jgi:hypothetical protein
MLLNTSKRLNDIDPFLILMSKEVKESKIITK